MKRNQTIRIAAILFAVLPFAFSACVKDQCTRSHTYTYYTPVYKTKAEVRANIKSNAPKDVVNTGKLCILGNYIFLNEVDKGIHVINNANPSSPQRVTFIDIPGNMDIAVKGNILYADLYTDLVAIDISNPSNVTVKKVIENQFPHRYWSGGFVADNSQVIVEWQKVDTTVTESCGQDFWATIENDLGGGAFFANPLASAGSSSSSSPIGVGGSMARFTIFIQSAITISMCSISAIRLTLFTATVSISAGISKPFILLKINCSLAP
jgi:hypothetical protein